MSNPESVYKPSQPVPPTAFVRAMILVGKAVNTELKNPVDEVRLTQRGIRPIAVNALKDWGATASELGWIIKPRTLAHRKAKLENLTPEETGRWLRVAKAQALAFEVFGNPQKGSAWLHKVNQPFEGQTAMDLLKTEAGAQLVMDTLNELDAGYFA